MYPILAIASVICRHSGTTSAPNTTLAFACCRLIAAAPGSVPNGTILEIATLVPLTAACMPARYDWPEPVWSSAIATVILLAPGNSAWMTLTSAASSTCSTGRNSVVHGYLAMSR